MPANPLTAMRLHVSVGPNPRIVRMYLAERGLEVPEIHVDLPGGENRRAPFLALNPAGQLPVLELAGGRAICETVSICEYLEAVLPPGATEPPYERALARMWLRRIEELYARPVSQAFRYGPGLKLFSTRMRCLPEAAAGMAALARDGEAWLNSRTGDPGFPAAANPGLAAIVLYCFMDFAARRANLPLLPEHGALQDWFAQMDARPSAQASHAMAYGVKSQPDQR